MTLMIKYSGILTIMIQAFFITVAGFIFVGCGSELIEDIKRSRKMLKRKGGNRNLREYTCSECGFSAWALDNIKKTKCHQCGASVITKPVPKIEKSSVCCEKAFKNELKFIEK